MSTYIWVTLAHDQRMLVNTAHVMKVESHDRGTLITLVTGECIRAVGYITDYTDRLTILS